MVWSSAANHSIRESRTTSSSADASAEDPGADDASAGNAAPPASATHRIISPKCFVARPGRGHRRRLKCGPPECPVVCGPWVSFAQSELGRTEVVGVEQWAEVRRLRFVRGLSQREIHGRTGLHRDTIRNVINSDRPPNYE